MAVEYLVGEVNKYELNTLIESGLRLSFVSWPLGIRPWYLYLREVSRYRANKRAPTMPNQACFRHIEAIIPTLPHFNDFLVNKRNKKEGRKTKWRKYKKEEYRTRSLIKHPLSTAKPCGKKALWIGEKSAIQEKDAIGK